MTKSDQNSVSTPKFNIATDDEKSHKMRQLMLAEGGHGQEISDLINALQKIGYFESFRVADNCALSSVKPLETQQRRLRTRRKARYRRIKKYYKSVKQYKKERLRRKLCWLLSGKFTQTEIAEMLGISVRTVIRDLRKIYPYYYRLNTSYLCQLKEENKKQLEEAMVGLSDIEKLKFLTDRYFKTRELFQVRKYHRHYPIIMLDLTQTDKYGIPKLTFIPKGRQTLAYPYKVRVHVRGSYEGRIFMADIGGFEIVQTTGSWW